MDIADLDLTTATTAVGDVFRLHVDDGRVLEFELVEAEPFAVLPPGAEDRGQNFSMLFRGPVEPVLNQATLPFHHETWGVIDLFVVPVGQDESGTQYESIVNRLP